MSARASVPIERLVRGMRQRLWRTRLAIRRRRTPMSARSYPTLDLAAAPWAITLFEPEFSLVQRDDARRQPAAGSETDTIVLDETDLATPFVQPITMNPSARSSVDEAALPPGFAELASAARREVSATPPRRRSGALSDAWLAATATAHGSYRNAHQRTTTHVVNRALATQCRPCLVLDHEVAIVCATNRPAHLDNIVENYQRQRYGPCRLVVVTNSSEFDLQAVERRLSVVPGASVIAVPEHQSLGTCLNAGMKADDARFVAKFDDDDRYGPEYLVDLMVAHRFARAGVVGKHSHVARFTTDDRTYVRFPGREFEYTSWVAGGTLVIDRNRVGDLQFRDLSLGEDGAFLADCQRAGQSIYAADRFHYVQHRTDSNTWKIRRKDYLRHAIEIDQRQSKAMIEP